MGKKLDDMNWQEFNEYIHYYMDAKKKIATKDNIIDIIKVLNFIGIAEKQGTETDLEAVERTFPVAEQTDGAIVVCAGKDFIYIDHEWKYILIDDNSEYRFDIIEYEDFQIYKIKGSYYYFSLDNSNTFCPLENIATLQYTIVNDIQVKDGKTLHSLFDCDVCGELVLDDHIEYLWFKKKER